MDAAHDKLYGRIADLLAQEAQKRNGNLVVSTQIRAQK